ncbi:MAG: hypothetical protein OXT65_02325, partial [Alphaproteobacteria bacterium]|nr:hypothetical protein [Alphaproteobacteria bacterium]
MKKLILLCGTFFVLVAAAPALADGLHLDKVIVNFAPDKKPIENITVTNKSERALKVTVKTVQVIHSGVKGKVEEETDQLKVAVNTEKSDSSEITPPVEAETGQ